MRDLEGADGDVNLHPGCHMVTQNLDHPANGSTPLGGLLDQFNQNDLVIFCTCPHIWRDQNVMGNMFVAGDNRSYATLKEMAPDNLLCPPLQNLDDLPLPLASTVDTHNRDQQTISMHH